MLPLTLNQLTALEPFEGYSEDSGLALKVMAGFLTGNLSCEGFRWVKSYEPKYGLGMYNSYFKETLLDREEYDLEYYLRGDRFMTVTVDRYDTFDYIRFSYLPDSVLGNKHFLSFTISDNGDSKYCYYARNACTPSEIWKLYRDLPDMDKFLKEEAEYQEAYCI